MKKTFWIARDKNGYVKSPTRVGFTARGFVDHLENRVAVDHNAFSELGLDVGEQVKVKFSMQSEPPLGHPDNKITKMAKLLAEDHAGTKKVMLIKPKKPVMVPAILTTRDGKKFKIRIPQSSAVGRDNIPKKETLILLHLCRGMCHFNISNGGKCIGYHVGHKATSFYVRKCVLLNRLKAIFRRKA